MSSHEKNSQNVNYGMVYYIYIYDIIRQEILVNIMLPGISIRYYYICMYIPQCYSIIVEWLLFTQIVLVTSFNLHLTYQPTQASGRLIVISKLNPLINSYYL